MIAVSESLAQLQSLGSSRPDDRTRHVAQEFESLLLSEMLRTGSKPLFGETPLDGGSAGRMARDQFFAQLAEVASRAGGIGLADRLEAQMRARSTDGASNEEAAGP